jgi:hypothetical protein
MLQSPSAGRHPRERRRVGLDHTAQPCPSAVPNRAGAPLVARRDLSRQYAELIDVPIANEHLDRGYLVAAISRTVAPPLRPQSLYFEVDGRHISIVNHDPFPLTMHAPNFRSNRGDEVARF